MARNFHRPDPLVLPAQFANIGKADAIVFTWPQLCFLAERFPDITRVYYCKDPFELWHWGPDFIRPLETPPAQQRRCRLCRLPSSHNRSGTAHAWKAFYLPNGFCDWFLPDQNLPRPADLPTGKPIIGSVGQINKDYDWDYISAIAAALPEVTICFIGPLDEPDAQAQRRVHKIITTTPNILWLGWRKYRTVTRLHAPLRHPDKFPEGR